jgi:putative Ca2+/H+ antiporter (TMEM165/GDT1 family)
VAAHHHSALSVSVGATLALWAVAAIAVLSGQTLLRFVNVATIPKVTAVVLVATGRPCHLFGHQVAGCPVTSKM